jgi:hypothetical protein
MAIIRYTKDATIRYAYLNIFPDQFKTEKEKMDESWIKEYNGLLCKQSLC